MADGNSLYERYAHIREKLQLELNRLGRIQPISFDVYKKTPEEKLQLKIAKAEHKEYQRQLKGLV
jgi:hypothetical protein